MGRACKDFREVWAKQIAGAVEFLHPTGPTFAIRWRRLLERKLEHFLTQCCLKKGLFPHQIGLRHIIFFSFHTPKNS
jgi:hypothetical protein